jgi:hypothetical protein
MTARVASDEHTIKLYKQITGQENENDGDASAKPNLWTTKQSLIPQIVKQIKKSGNSPEHKSDLPTEYANLANKTGIDYKQLNLLNNPLLPHGLQESKHLLATHYEHSHLSVLTMCENM